MSRRRAAEKRDLRPDPKYKSVELTRFVNKLMKNGKKTVAQRIVYQALDVIAEQTKREPMEVFNLALDNSKPLLEVKPRRVGGATYQVPVEVRPSRRTALAMRWLVDSARQRGEKSMALRLAGEIADAAEGRGATVRRREDTHKMAEANRAFAHYRF